VAAGPSFLDSASENKAPAIFKPVSLPICSISRLSLMFSTNSAEAFCCLIC
jgi:hypothetical protein